MHLYLYRCKLVFTSAPVLAGRPLAGISLPFLLPLCTLTCSCCTQQGTMTARTRTPTSWQQRWQNDLGTAACTVQRWLSLPIQATRLTSKPRLGMKPTPEALSSKTCCLPTMRRRLRCYSRQVQLRSTGTRQTGQTVLTALPKQEKPLGIGLSQRCSSRSSPMLCKPQGSSGPSSWKPCSPMLRSGHGLAGIKSRMGITGSRQSSSRQTVGLREPPAAHHLMSSGRTLRVQMRMQAAKYCSSSSSSRFLSSTEGVASSSSSSSSGQGDLQVQHPCGLQACTLRSRGLPEECKQP